MEGLDDVVVGAGVEAGDFVAERVARGQHQDGRARLRGPHAPTDLEAVEAGQHDVEQEQSGIVCSKRNQGGSAVRRRVKTV